MKKTKDFFIKYIETNIKEYILVTLIFIIGLLIGVMIINNCDETQISEISSYIRNFVSKLSQVENINRTTIFWQSIKKDVILAFCLWFTGTTIIGIPIVLAIILGRGITLGYTISAITIAFGTGKGLFFCLISLLVQNLVFIPSVLTLGVSGVRLYKSIIKERQIENIKYEIIGHTIISIIMVILLIGASFIENYVALEILKKFIKYF